jgi:hypothetical protein
LDETAKCKDHHGMFSTDQSMEVPMYRRSHVVISRSTSHLAKRLAQPFTRSKLLHAVRVMGLTLVAPTFAGVAHAQGTMDFSGATTLMATFKTFAIYAGSVICFGGLIFAGIRMMSGRFQDAIPGLFGALFGAAVLGWGAGWIGSLTGQQM